MFGWFKKKEEKFVESEIQKSFDNVKNDFEAVTKWIKHLDQQDKQVFDNLNSLNDDLATMREEMKEMREEIEVLREMQKDQQLFKKTAVSGKQTAVYGVQEAVQTGVQTANFYDILKNLSSNERLIVLTLLNQELKLSYEDLALLLGKEKATIRGQVNSIKQKCEGLIEEMAEKNGKKRVFIPDEIKEKMSKYVKVRVKSKKKE